MVTHPQLTVSILSEFYNPYPSPLIVKMKRVTNRFNKGDKNVEKETFITSLCGYMLSLVFENNIFLSD